MDPAATGDVPVATTAPTTAPTTTPTTATTGQPARAATTVAGTPVPSAAQRPPTTLEPQASPMRGSVLSFGHWSISRGGYRRIEDEELGKIERRSSILLPHLQMNEKQFFELVASNNVDEVRDFLAANEGFNINCVNFQGVSALHIAVQNKSEPMVEFLLKQPKIDIGDCILHAVRDNQIKIMQMLLDRMQEISPGLEYVGVTHSSDFPDYITPLILAAQCGHFEVIEYLIERGHRIMKPHPPDCKCAECILHWKHDDLLHGETLRLNLYRAITNPAYICHSSHDPILTAFELSRELLLCSRMLPEFCNAYRELATEISGFAVDLIACCRSTEEIDLILRQKSEEAGPGLVFPRLVLALNYKQKAFVAHPNTQQIVEAVWHGDWHEWKYKPMYLKYAMPFIRLAVMPFIVIFCLILPKHPWVAHWSIPLNKMITHISANFVFLSLLFLQSNADKTGQKRSPPNTGLEPFIILFVMGYIWSSFRMCMIKGPRQHFQSMWSIFDVVMYLLFVLTFLFWLASYFDIQQNGQIDLERKYWHRLDPVLIAEGCFCVAVIMAFFRLMILFRLNYFLGPLQISLGKMSADIAKYILIFAVLLIAFATGTSRFYQPYEGMVQIDDNAMKVSQASSFVNFSSALKTFFWAIFCMAPTESADVIIENLPGEKDKTTITNHHEFTEAVGYIVFGVFEVLSVIILLNMLIATMSNTFQRVTDNVDVEWIFGKTEFYVEYMNQSILPPPINLIPTAQGIAAVIEWIQVASKTPVGRTARCTANHFCFIETEVDPQLASDFPILMSQIVQRYFREKDGTTDTALDEIELLRNDIAEIKQILKGPNNL